MSLGSQIIYKQLFQRHGRIRIPMIQRDYAQGRPAEIEVREEFLNALEEALQKPANDPTLPLNLDFIYGSVEGDDETRFLPLDGQQRLTTLFLLHWYLAWRDEQWDEFKQLFQADQHSRFAYSVRPSSNEFFDELVVYRPDVSPEDVLGLAQLISNQPWYFRSWRLDPTIQSVLHMLDAIHKRFASSTGLFYRLTDESQPAITFQLLDLENFGLSDDLYIKMNARGKPLTPFETFKARYEQELKKQFHGTTFRIGEQSFSVADYIALRLDTVWTDLFWKLRDKKSNLYDGALMNVFRAVVLVTRSPDNDAYLNDTSFLRFGAPSYTVFHSHGWLDERFTLAIIHLLDAWSAESGKLSTLLPDSRYFDEAAIFKKIVSSGANLSYLEIVQFAAYVGFVTRHQDQINAVAFQEWMRIVYNLSVNTEYNRPDDLRRSIVGLNQLLEHSADVLNYFAETTTPASGFNEQQIAEEKLKAGLILAHDAWRELIDRAEAHGYFRGQIEFLLGFSGIIAASTESEPDHWGAELHPALQESFSRYCSLAEQMFISQGLKDVGHRRWQRALLAIGDYLLPRGRNYSFLTNSSTDESSWKRLLRGTGPNVPEARGILKKLWEQLSPEDSLIEQLDKIIHEPREIGPWREALVHCPRAFDFCRNNFIRWDGTGAIYLLKRTQMNGEHAELFTYCLYQKLAGKRDSFSVLQPAYETVTDTYFEPHLRLFSKSAREYVAFRVDFIGNQYRIRLIGNGTVANLEDTLKDVGFVEAAGSLQLSSSRSDIEGALMSLDQALSSII
jgi:hypothetical protein